MSSHVWGYVTSLIEALHVQSVSFNTIHCFPFSSLLLSHLHSSLFNSSSLLSLLPSSSPCPSPSLPSPHSLADNSNLQVPRWMWMKAWRFIALWRKRPRVHKAVPTSANTSSNSTAAAAGAFAASASVSVGPGAAVGATSAPGALIPSLSPSLSLLGGSEGSEKDPRPSLIDSTISVKMEVSESVTQNYGNQLESQSSLQGGNGNQMLTESKDNSGVFPSDNENRENTAINLPTRTDFNLSHSGVSLSETEGGTETTGGDRGGGRERDPSATRSSGEQTEIEIETATATDVGLVIKCEKLANEMDIEKEEERMIIQEPIKIEKILDLTIPDRGPLVPRPPTGPQDAAMKRAETKRKAQSMIADAHHRFMRERNCLRRGLGANGREMDISSLSRVASMAAVYLHLTGK